MIGNTVLYICEMASVIVHDIITMLRVHTKQMKDGSWVCHTTFAGSDFSETNRTIISVQSLMKYRLNKLCVKDEDIVFEEEVWRPYNYSEVMKRNPFNSEKEFCEGQVVEICPGNYATRPYYAIVKQFKKNRTLDGEDTRMILHAPGGKYGDRRVTNNTWEWMHRRMRIIGMEEDFTTEILTQILIGIK